MRLHARGQLNLHIPMCRHVSLSTHQAVEPLEAWVPVLGELLDEAQAAEAEHPQQRRSQRQQEGHQPDLAVQRSEMLLALQVLQHGRRAGGGTVNRPHVQNNAHPRFKYTRPTAAPSASTPALLW